MTVRKNSASSKATTVLVTAAIIIGGAWFLNESDSMLGSVGASMAYESNYDRSASVSLDLGGASNSAYGGYMVTSSSLSLKTSLGKFDKDFAKLEEIGKAEGTVTNKNSSKGEDYASGNLSVKVGVNNVASTVEKLSKVATLTSSNISMSDLEKYNTNEDQQITETQNDIAFYESEIKYLEEHRDSDDYWKLSNLRDNLRYAQDRLHELQEHQSEPTVEISVHLRGEIGPVQEGWNAFAEGFGPMFGFLAPLVLLGIAVFFVLKIVFRFINKGINKLVPVAASKEIELADDFGLPPLEQVVRVEIKLLDALGNQLVPETVVPVPAAALEELAETSTEVAVETAE